MLTLINYVDAQTCFRRYWVNYVHGTLRLNWSQKTELGIHRSLLLRKAHRPVLCASNFPNTMADLLTFLKAVLKEILVKKKWIKEDFGSTVMSKSFAHLSACSKACWHVLKEGCPWKRAFIASGKSLVIFFLVWFTFLYQLEIPLLDLRIECLTFKILQRFIGDARIGISLSLSLSQSFNCMTQRIKPMDYRCYVNVSDLIQWKCPSTIICEAHRKEMTKARKRIKPFPNKPLFWHVYNTSLLKTLWEQEKLLVMSNFSFSHSVFYTFGELSAIYIKLGIVVFKLSQFWRV